MNESVNSSRMRYTIHCKLVALSPPNRRRNASSAPQSLRWRVTTESAE